MKKLLVLSGKGGTGKTTTVSAFIELGKIKAMADCDVDAPNLHILNKFDKKSVTEKYYGGEKAIIDYNKCISCGKCFENCHFQAISKENGTYKISEFKCEGCGVCEYVCPQEAISLVPDISGEINLYKDERVFSTAKLKIGRGNSGKLVKKVKDTLYKNVIEDVAIIDGSPGIGCPVMSSISGVDLILIVTEPTMSGQSDLERIIKTAEMSCTKFAVCINKYDVNSNISNGIEEWCKEKNISFVGKIPYDSNVSLAINQGKNIISLNNFVSKAMQEVYKNTMRLLENNNENSMSC